MKNKDFTLQEALMYYRQKLESMKENTDLEITKIDELIKMNTN